MSSSEASLPALHEIIHHLEIQHRPTAVPYLVPGLWGGGKLTAPGQEDPFEFYHHRLTGIAQTSPQPLVQGRGGGGWSRQPIIYNLFPWVTTALDHHRDGGRPFG